MSEPVWRRCYRRTMARSDRNNRYHCGSGCLVLIPNYNDLRYCFLYEVRSVVAARTIEGEDENGVEDVVKSFAC